jgi:hypothetical protein
VQTSVKSLLAPLGRLVPWPCPDGDCRPLVHGRHLGRTRMLQDNGFGGYDPMHFTAAGGRFFLMSAGERALW